MSLDLTTQQEKAYKHYKGPGIVIAGPGAGKTFVITQRVKWLIQEKNINPENILVTTFTEKAADELKVKLATSITQGVERIHISTIHSFCKTMLEKYFLYTDYGAEINVIDDESQYLILDLYKFDFGLTYWKNRRPQNIKRAYNFISKVNALFNKLIRNRIDPDTLLEYMKSEPGYNDSDFQIIESYKTYKEYLHTEKMMDFAHLQTEFYELISNNEEVLEEIQQRFEFMLVDEYQDTSPIQDKIFRKIAEKNKNLFVVGDENQSIYGFRGASIRNFKNFVSNYPNSNEYFLNVNFRSTETIVDFSNKIFDRGIKKLLETRRRKGEKFKLIYGLNIDDTAKKSIDLIKKLKQDSIIKNYGDVALLFRSLKNHAKEYIKYLDKENIPYVTFGDGNLLKREEIQTVLYLLAYVSQRLYISNKFKKWEWWRKDLFLTEFFNFSKQTKKIITEGNFNLYELIDEATFKEEGFKDETDIKKLKKLNLLKYEIEKENEKYGFLQRGNNSLLKIFYKILDCSGYFKYLMDNQTVENKKKLHNLGKLSGLITRYMNVSRKDKVDDFLWFLYNNEDNFDQELLEDENTVKLMTVHQSKGLEFPVVYMCCMNEGRFPLYYKNRSFFNIPDEMLDKQRGLDRKQEFFQEERRLFYVGISRTQDNLIFTASEKIKVNRCQISRFLQILNDDTILDGEFKQPAEKKYKVEETIPALNYSAINAFIDCPLRYYLTYEFDFVTPPSYGQELGLFIHNTIQRIHEEMKQGNKIKPEKMKAIVERYWIDLAVSKDRNKKLKKQMLKHFVDYYLNAKNEFDEILAIEESFAHIDENFIVNGRIDLIAKDKNGDVCLIDFKAREQEGIEKTNVDKQLQTYQYCVDCEYDIDKIMAYTFMDNKKTEFTINPEETKNLLTNISQKMSEGKFHKQENSFCRSCQFNFYCWRR